MSATVLTLTDAPGPDVIAAIDGGLSSALAVLVSDAGTQAVVAGIIEKEHPSIASVRIGTETASQHGIEGGQRAIIRSPVGHLEVEVIVDARVGRGMVIMPVGTWIKRGGGANVLTEDIMSNFGQMAAYGETRVRLEPLCHGSASTSYRRAMTR